MPKKSRTPDFRDQSGTEQQPEDRANDLRSEDDLRSVSMASEPSEAAIRIRAYQIYLDRGAADGLDFNDWLQAEQELKKGQS